MQNCCYTVRGLPNFQDGRKFFPFASILWKKFGQFRKLKKKIMLLLLVWLLHSPILTLFSPSVLVSLTHICVSC